MPSLGRYRLARLALAAGAVFLLSASLPGAASAHAFLIRSQPQAGARLARAPATLTLYFSERFVRGSQQVTLRRASGEAIKLPASRASGAVIVQPLPRSLRGVFVVHWRVLSDDGH